VPQALRLVLLAALLVFVVVGEPPERTRFWRELFNLGHAPLWGLLALVIRGYLANRRGAWRWAAGSRAAAAFALAVGLGAAVEAVQLLQSDRNASWSDLARDAAGAGAFLMLREALARRDRPSAASRRLNLARGAAALTGVALLAAASTTFARTVALYAERNHAMPTLFALDGSWWERALIGEEHGRLRPGTGLARLDLEPAGYPGLSFDEPYPDWRGYRTLVLTIVSDLEAPLPMAIRVHDAPHNQRFGDRFNRRLLVQPGENTFRVPIDEIRRAPRGREMDLARIRGIMIFTRDLDHATHVYLGPLRLER
jgi:VanZ family protein